MKKKKVDLKNSNMRELTRNLIKKAQKKNLVKPLSQAFKDIPAADEIHKGKKEYFYDQ